MRIALVGAGSMQFTHQVVSDLLAHPATRDADYHLIDTDADRLQRACQLVRGLLAQRLGQGQVAAFADVQAEGALRQVDYCINEIQVGGFAATERDFAIPARYGIRQTIADTRGIGGILRALRTMPVCVAVARALAEASPDALLLNYTNPMAMVMDAVHRTVPELLAYGLCHSTEETARTLAGYLEVPYDELDWTAAGINHMAWLLTLTHHGEDLYPRLDRLAQDPKARARDPVRFELLQAVGRFVTESSEHNAEYFAWFVTHPEEIDRLQIPIGEYLRRSEAHLVRYEALRQDLAEGHVPAVRPPSGEYAPRLVAARTAREPLWFYANVPNRVGALGDSRLIGNLPPEALVEVPCGLFGTAVRPTAVGSLPLAAAALNAQAIAVEQLTVEGFCRQDRDLIYQAAMLDPVTAAVLPLDQIRALVDEAVAAHGDLMPPLPRRRVYGSVAAEGVLVSSPAT